MLDRGDAPRGELRQQLQEVERLQEFVHVRRERHAAEVEVAVLGGAHSRERAARTRRGRTTPQVVAQAGGGGQVLALVQEDRLVAKNEEAVFQWVVRWWC